MDTWKLKSRQIYLHVRPWCSCTKPVYGIISSGQGGNVSSGQLTGLAFWKPLVQGMPSLTTWSCVVQTWSSNPLAVPVNSQLVGLLPVVILDLLKFHSDYLFQFCAQPHYKQHSYIIIVPRVSSVLPWKMFTKFVILHWVAKGGHCVCELKFHWKNALWSTFFLRSR